MSAEKPQMIGIDPEDIETLAGILEMERKGHVQKRSLCFWMFIVAFASLVLALILAGVHIAMMFTTQTSGVEIGDEMWMLQGLAPLAAASVSFFSMWWGVHNCVSSIDRTLYAARAKRHNLFAKFIDQIECADKKKKRKWLELVSAFVS